MEERRYGIDELADLVGVKRRTVRFYVQRGLLPPPFGVGRGKHYGPEHLARLRAVKALQSGGPQPRRGPAEAGRRRRGSARCQPWPPLPSRRWWDRAGGGWSLAPGIELHVSGRHRAAVGPGAPGAGGVGPAAPREQRTMVTMSSRTASGNWPSSSAGPSVAGRTWTMKVSRSRGGVKGKPDEEHQVGESPLPAPRRRSSTRKSGPGGSGLARDDGGLAECSCDGVDASRGFPRSGEGPGERSDPKPLSLEGASGVSEGSFERHGRGGDGPRAAS